MVSTKQMQITFVDVSAGVTSNLHVLGIALFADPNHRSQTSLVGRVGRFDYWDYDHHIHSEYITPIYVSAVSRQISDEY